MEKHAENLVKTKEVVGVDVKNMKNETLGEIEEIVLEKVSGRVVYVVLNSGSVLGMGGKLFAMPWSSIHYDPNKECFLLNLSKEELKRAPGFDKDHWPDMADQRWAKSITDFYSEKTTA